LRGLFQRGTFVICKISTGERQILSRLQGLKALFFQKNLK
jgi:hypothetical protein